MIRIILPAHLRTLAAVTGEVRVDVDGVVTQESVLDALESSHPVLCGAIRDRVSKRRRPFVRFFVGGEDLSHEPIDAALPPEVAAGTEPFCIVGAMAGG